VATSDDKSDLSQGMSPSTWRWVRAAIAVALLLVVVLRVNAIYSGYREAQEEQARLESAETTSSAETTESAEATATAADEQAKDTASDAEKETTEAPTRIVVVVQNGLNLRSAADLSSSVLDTLPRDTRLPLMGEENGWYRVETADGTVGYVSSSEQYVRVEEAP
jgi:uncharacterized protein YgiM (DUF1202 family)